MRKHDLIKCEFSEGQKLGSLGYFLGGGSNRLFYKDSFIHFCDIILKHFHLCLFAGWLNVYILSPSQAKCNILPRGPQTHFWPPLCSQAMWTVKELLFLLGLFSMRSSQPEGRRGKKSLPNRGEVSNFLSLLRQEAKSPINS